MDKAKVRFKLNSGGAVKVPFNDATCRQRGIRVYDGLRERGWDADEWDGTEHCDILFVQYNPDFIAACRPHCNFLVFDCNDAVFMFGTDKNFSNAISKCDYVITGSTEICKDMGRYTNPLCCSYMPECIDPMYDAVVRNPSGEGRILWMGGTDNIYYTDVVDNALERLSKLFNFTTVYCCPEFQASGKSNKELCNSKSFNTKFVKWTPESMITEMGTTDIAIAPLHQNKWCWCKSPNKAATFAGVGIPVVASDVPSYREFITQGKSGFLAYTDTDWEEMLGVLLGNAGLRGSISKEGMQSARDRYKIDVVVDSYAALIINLVGRN